MYEYNLEVADATLESGVVSVVLAGHLPEVDERGLERDRVDLLLPAHGVGLV